MPAMRGFVLEPVTNVSDLAATLQRWGTRPKPRANPGYAKCPQCATLMNRTQFARGAKIIIDLCLLHGVWFDQGELTAMIEFVRKGGLVAAKQRIQASENRVKASTRGAISLGGDSDSAEVWSLFEAMVRNPKPQS
jgi:Zn-finger nucleic acid-binding protein